MAGTHINPLSLVIILLKKGDFFMKENIPVNQQKRNEEYNEYVSLEDINESYYLAGDYKCWITGASNKEALKFLNSAKKIFEYLDEIETQQVNEVNKALEETNDM